MRSAEQNASREPWRSKCRPTLAPQGPPTQKNQRPPVRCPHPALSIVSVDLTTIEGIEEGTALVIISEIRTDMHRSPRVKHCCRWLGLCPQHRIFSGKVLARRVRPGAPRVTGALRLAARSLHHSPSALGAFFRRMKARLGTPKAITATAHKLARLVYSLLQHGSAYVQQGLEHLKAQDHERKVTTMAKQAKALDIPWCPSRRRDTTACPVPLRSRPSSQSASHALRRHRSPGSGAGLCPAPHASHPHPSISGSPTAVTPSQTLLTLLQKGLAFTGEFLVRPLHCCAAVQREGTRPQSTLYSSVAAGRVRPSTPVVPCARW